MTRNPGFKAGDVIGVMDATNREWWWGRVADGAGLVSSELCAGMALALAFPRPEKSQQRALKHKPESALGSEVLDGMFHPWVGLQAQGWVSFPGSPAWELRYSLLLRHHQLHLPLPSLPGVLRGQRRMGQK